MAVDNLNVIDVVSIDLNLDAVLSISDHLEWGDNNEHLLILQNKINFYLSAIENGSLYEKYPNAVGRKLIINVVAKYMPNKAGEIFLERIKASLENAGYGFTFSVRK